MDPVKIILYIAAAILIFFGVLFIWGAFSDTGSIGWIPVGIISVAIGFVLIWFGSRRAKQAGAESSSVTYQVDLPGNVELDQLKCQSCGGAITTDNIEMVAGAPVVNCPFCGTSYQLTEEPKW
jgi:uncharacterized membrane protein